MKKILAAGIMMVLCSANAFAQNVQSADLKATAKEISSGNSTQLDLKLTLNLNRRPNKECTVRYFVVFSDVGVPDSNTKRFSLLTQKIAKGSPRRINLSYRGAALDGDIGDQSQANFGATVRCGSEDVVESSIAAVNVTCEGGLTVNNLVRAFRSRLG